MSEFMSGQSPSRQRVVIVGGGLAGMSAAETLVRHAGERLSVDVLEAKRTTGGRAGSFFDPPSALDIDYCQHVAMGCCTNLIGLLERTGQLDQWERFTSLEFRHPRFRPSHFAPSSLLPPPLHLVRAMAALRYLSWKEKSQILRGLWRLMRTRSSQLESVCANDWLTEHGQSESTIELFWNVILVSALGDSTQWVSMAAARKVIIDGFAAARGASDVLVPRQPLATLFGVELPSALKELGVRLHTQRSAESLRVREDQRVEIHMTGAEPLLADDVILAVPWHVAAELLVGHLPRPQLDAWSAIASSPISGIHLWLDRELTDRTLTPLAGCLSQWLFRPPDRQTRVGREGAAGGEACLEGESYYQVVISGAADLRQRGKESLVSEVMSELNQLFPASPQPRLLRSRVVTDPRSVFSVRCGLEAVRPSATTSLPWLHLAGDWTKTTWPSTMEGAVISGRLAAGSVQQRRGGMVPAVNAGLPTGWFARTLIKS